MLFNSAAYLLFLPAVVLLFWLAPARLRTPLLLVASYGFYMSWKPVYGLLIFALTAANYFMALLLAKHHSKRKLILTVTVSFNLLTLAAFKYAYFGRDLSAPLLQAAGLPPLNVPEGIILPLGISFFVFEFIHYIADVYKGGAPIKSFPQFALFASFFPTQIAGPIKRYQDFIPQLTKKHRFTIRKLDEGVELILFGLFKKVLFADNLALVVQSSFEHPGLLTTADAWLAVYAFAFQIYFDFSGYTDIARGSARLLGFKVPDNFKLPYLASSISEFWKRWHISLSTWLRDYLFIPLGGSRQSRLLTHRNLFLTMLLGGLWHGAGMTFIIWGAYQGLALIVHKEWRALCERFSALESLMATKFMHAVSVILTFHVVCIGWVFFRAGNPAKALTLLGKMFAQAPQPAGFTAWQTSIELAGKEPVYTLLPAILLVLLAGQLIAFTFKKQTGIMPFKRPLKAVYLASLAVLLIVYSPDVTPKFIYFQF